MTTSVLKNKWFIFSVVGILLVLNNWSLPLWDQDEAAYAGFAKTMNETNDYLVPQYYFSEPHRKTPLHFWDIALSFKIFGENEFAVRFPSFLAILGTFLLMYFRGRKLLGEQKALNSLWIISSSILVISLAKVSVTDATLLFFTTLSAFGIIQTLQEPSNKWIFLFWLGFAMGLLTKGPPIIVFSGIFVALLFVFHPNRKNLFKLKPWFFLPLALLPLFLWCYAIYLRGEVDFLKWLFDWYILKRIGGSVYGQEGIIGTHILFIFIFSLFSTLFFFRAIKDSVRGFFMKDPTLIVVGSWFIAGWLFYEFSPSKLPTYVIAAYVPLAFLMGNYSAELENNKARPHKAVLFIHYVLQVIFGIGLIISYKFLNIHTELAVALIIIGIVWLVNLMNQLIQLQKPYYLRYVMFSNTLLLIALWSIAPLFTQHINSSQKVSKYVLEHTQPSSAIIIGYAPGSQPSLPFYLSANNNKIIVQENTDSLLLQVAQLENFALIISKEQQQLFQEIHPEWDFVSVRSRLIDRKEEAEYLVTIVN